MSDEVLVRVQGVSKKFCRDLKKSLWYGLKDIATELNPFRGRADSRSLMVDGNSDLNSEPSTLNQHSPPASEDDLRPGEFYAVKDVSFELRRGECLGLIGRNGAGKTTLLKMLNGLIKPDTGRIEMRGRVGALIALGAGFNPILTGRENIYVNGSILGLTKREIDEKMDEIIDFSEIGEFIDSPVQSYSSGMQVRLGFAVATALEPDVLIIDEVFAVGDARFRSRCYERIDSLRRRAAILFVSHNMPQIARLCSKSLVLDKGTTICIGNTPECILKYEQINAAEGTTSARHGTGLVRVVSVNFLSLSSHHKNKIPYGAAVDVKLVVEASEAIPELVVDIGFRTIGKELVAECNNYVTSIPLSINSPSSRVEVTAHVERLPLNPGVYHVSCFLLNRDMTLHYDWWEEAIVIEIDSGKPAIAGTQLPATWGIIEIPPEQ